MNTTITVSQFKITENCRNDSIPSYFLYLEIYIFKFIKRFDFFYLFYGMNVNNAKYTKSQPSKPTTAEDFLPKKNKEQKQQKIFKLSTRTLTNYTGKKKDIHNNKIYLDFNLIGRGASSRISLLQAYTLFYS